MGKKYIVRLNTTALKEEQISLNLTDPETAFLIGVSTTQLWRAKLDINDHRYNSPGGIFIASVLSAFNSKFEKFFYLDSVLRQRNDSESA